MTASSIKVTIAAGAATMQKHPYTPRPATLYKNPLRLK